MMTVKQFLEHCSPQQKVIIYPDKSDLEQSGIAKDMLKECWYLDNEVTEFFLCAISKGYIGVYTRTPMGVEKHDNIDLTDLGRIIFKMIESMRKNKLESRRMIGSLRLINEKYNIDISINKKV